MQKIFLTGANGHIGANITRVLLDRGYEVVGYVRETSDLRTLAGLDIELHKGDIRDPDKVMQAAAGCDAIIHTAAVYSMWAPDDDDILSPSMEGTDNILQAAHDHGIRRVVYTSSAVAIGGTNNPDVVRDENDWNDYAKTAYYSAKTDSERLALGLAQQLDLEIITLNPTIVLGPYDFRVTPSTGVILGALNGSAPFWDGRIGIVHVDDVARLHVDGLTSGVPGERYIVNDVTLHLKDLQKYLAERFGVRAMVVGLPEFISRPTGALLGWIGKLLGKPPIYDDRIYDDTMAVHGNYSNKKSIETFGIDYKGLEATLADTTAWLIHAGMVKEKVAQRLKDQYPPNPEWL
jgi:dihydroflavonol-4-reductase